MKIQAACVALMLGLVGAASAQEGEGLEPPPGVRRARTLAFVAPKTWRRAPLQEGERHAFYLAGTPAREGARAPSLRLSVYKLGKTKDGAPRTLKDQAARWVRQWLGADDAPLTTEAAATRPIKGTAVPTTLVRLVGTYFVAAAPGADERTRHPGWAGIYGFLEGPDGAWTVILTGPGADVERLQPELIKFLQTAEVVVGTRPDPREREGREEPAGER